MQETCQETYEVLSGLGFFMESRVSEGYSSTELVGQEKHPNCQADGNPTLENVTEQDKENTSSGVCSHLLKQCAQANPSATSRHCC